MYITTHGNSNDYYRDDNSNIDWDHINDNDDNKNTDK